MFGHEISLMLQFNHSRIIRYIGCQRHGGEAFIFMEYLPEGSLSDEIKRVGTINEAKACRYTHQILEGLEYLHALRVIHRDVKSANVLRDRGGNVKIADFGMSTLLDSVETENNGLSSIYYTAPEVVTNSRYGCKADVWSLACIVLEMLTGSYPWKELEPCAALFAIGEGCLPVLNLPVATSHHMADLVTVLFSRNPDQRPTATDALSHPVFQLE